MECLRSNAMRPEKEGHSGSLAKYIASFRQKYPPVENAVQLGLADGDIEKRVIRHLEVHGRLRPDAEARNLFRAKLAYWRRIFEVPERDWEPAAILRELYLLKEPLPAVAYTAADGQEVAPEEQEQQEQRQNQQQANELEDFWNSYDQPHGTLSTPGLTE